MSNCDGSMYLLRMSVTCFASSWAQKYTSRVCNLYICLPWSRGSVLAKRHSLGSLLGRGELGEVGEEPVGSTRIVTSVGNLYEFMTRHLSRSTAVSRD